MPGLTGGLLGMGGALDGLFDLDFVGRLLAVAVPLVYVVGVLSALDAVMTARTPQGSVAWAVALLSFPLVALPLYWAFGRSRYTHYVDRLRRRQPGDETLGLSPHMDAGTVERWIDPGYQRVYRHVFAGDWRGYDPFDATYRLETEEIPSPAVCSMFRTYQGWTALTRQGPKNPGRLLHRQTVLRHDNGRAPGDDHRVLMSRGEISAHACERPFTPAHESDADLQAY